MKKVLLSLIISTVFISSCTNSLVNVNDSSIKNFQKVNNLDKNVKGKVNFPRDFNIKSTLTDVAIRATVSLIYPSDYSNADLRNISIAAGVTDSDGGFVITVDPLFSPNIGDIFTLEATKRVNKNGSTGLISIRTNLKWIGNGWDSITGENIVLNIETSVLSAISNLNPSDLSPAETINKVTVDNNGDASFETVNNISIGQLNYLKDQFRTSIYMNEDPIQNLFYDTQYPQDGYNYFLSGHDSAVLSSVKANMHTMQTAAETHAVDYQGCYAVNLEALIAEGTSKHYYKKLKNPIYPNSNLPSAMNYDDYITAKQTLKYKDIDLESKEDLSGIVLYRIKEPYQNDPTQNNMPCPTTYEIYGTDFEGEFIKDGANNNVFVLTNN